MKLCTIDGCLNELVAKGLCCSHRYRVRKHGDPLAHIPLRKLGSRANVVCSFLDCNRPHEARGYCVQHDRQVKSGKGLRPIRSKGSNGSGTLKNGYRLIGVQGSYKLEHRIIMEELLGRALLPGENVHHINGVRDDNRLENLELWVVSQPSGQRPEDLVQWAKEILRRYDDK